MIGPLSLFALTADPAKRIVRFALSNDAEQELIRIFDAQERAFDEAVQDRIPFDGKYRPDYGECLVIQDFDDLDELSRVVADPLLVQEIAADPTEFNEIKALFCGYLNQSQVATILIQNFDRRRVLSNTGFSLFHSSNVYRRVEGIGLTIDTKLTAILKGVELAFFSFFTVRQIFDLSLHYKEATDADIQIFADLPSIQVADVPGLFAISDNWIRRKFSLIAQSGVLDDVSMVDIRRVAQEFQIPLDIQMVNGVEAIILPGNKAELKRVLRFLDEDYYKSSFRSRLHIANSKRPA